MSYNEKLFGVGVNDSDYIVRNHTLNVICPFYVKWSSMITRCYSVKFLADNPAYDGCTVCNDWLTFSNFKEWMQQQDWEGKELDKDLLNYGNKVYSHDNCVFISAKLNSFISGSSKKRGGSLLIGVCFLPKRNKYVAQCSDPDKLLSKFIGHFDTEEEARNAWLRRKHEIAVRLASLEVDDRIITALKNRYRGDL